MTVRAKIYALPALAAGFLLLMLGVISSLGAKNSELLGQVENGYAPAAELNRDLLAMLGELQRSMSDAVAAEDPDGLSKVDTIRDQFVAKLSAARSNPVLEADKLDKLQAEFLTYLLHAKQTSGRMIRKEANLGGELSVMTEQYNALQKRLTGAAEDSKQASANAFAEVRRVYRSSQIAIFVMVVLCALLLGFISSRVARQVVRPLQSLTDAAQRIASTGDLTQNIEVQTKDEIGQLAGAFSTMVSQLRDVRQAIEAAAQNVVAAAAQIQAASQEQEAASQTQSSGVEEVNRTMQSLLESATHIAASANGVSSNAERAKETSATTATKISELSGRTAKMAEILEVIREIADRSDLLALNASLEGTRAGEAGRGFSLVASEMRRLSERVTASVQTVKELVNDVRASGASTVMVTEEARSLAENTATSARQITLVTQQQRTATEMVSTSMKEVAGVLVRTLSATSQTKRAAADLASQAERLTGLVKKFKVEVKTA